jgi:hypothetical protein
MVGAVSAAIYGPQAIGILVGVGALTSLDNDGVLGDTVRAIVLLVAAAPFATWHRERLSALAPPLTFRSLVEGF